MTRPIESCGVAKHARVTWAGVDVGGQQKGFHVAVVDDRGLVAGPEALGEAHNVVDWFRPWQPAVVAVDCPCQWATDGERSRACEREFLKANICHIRFTPAKARAEGKRYYDWIRCGLALYRALRDGRWGVIECFPTASWTQWGGQKRAETRARWSARILGERRLKDVPNRLNQDGRDAIAAALTARAWAQDETQEFGEIVVPKVPTTRTGEAG